MTVHNNYILGKKKCVCTMYKIRMKNCRSPKDGEILVKVKTKTGAITIDNFWIVASCSL